MIAHDQPVASSVKTGVARPVARAGIALAVLWLLTAFLLRGPGEFCDMIAVLTCASVVLGGFGRGRWFLVGQLVLWTALLTGTVVALSESPSVPGMLALFGAAALWFVIAEPMVRARSAP